MNFGLPGTLSSYFVDSLQAERLGAALLFSSMVASFNSSNIGNFGPLCMVAFLCQALGLSLALIVRCTISSRVTPIPR